MALELQDKKMLDYPFPAKAHKFIGENAYLHEEPITDRLDMVDLNWSWVIIKIDHRDNAGNGGKDVGTVTVHGRLTVKGVSRDGIGMAVIQQTNPLDEYTWENGTKKKTGKTYTNEANEAEKSATTDAFKRAARMFGMGRYLLTLPKQNGKATVTDIAGLEKWLKATYGDIQAMPTYYDETTQEESESQTANPLEPDFHGLGKDASPLTPAQWETALKVLILPLYKNVSHRDNGLKSALQDNFINHSMSVSHAAACMFGHRAMSDFKIDYETVVKTLGKDPQDFIQSPDSFKSAWNKLTAAMSKQTA